MKRILYMISAVTILLTGCYDMTDIEDIETVTSVYVEPEKTTFCTVTTIPGEKNYGYRLYEELTDDINKGLNGISRKTGKEISVSHLNTIIFSKECDMSLIKQVCDAAVSSSDFHPKIATIISDMSSTEFYENMSVSEDTVMYRHLSDVLRNRYAAVTDCTLIRLYRAIHSEIPGANLPVFTLDDGGNIVSNGICHIGHDKIGFINNKLTDTLSLIENPGKSVYFNTDKISVAAVLKNSRTDFDRNENLIRIYLETEIYAKGEKIGNETIEYMKEKIQSDIIKICNEKNNGFDILNLSGEILKKFYSERDYHTYMQEQGGFFSMLKNLDFDITISVLEGDI